MQPTRKTEPPDNIESLRYLLFQRTLRSTAIFQLLLLAVALPFSRNKAAAFTAISLTTVLGVALPWWLMRSRRIHAASLVFLVGMGVPISVVFWLSQGLIAPAVVLQFALVVQAGSLLERNRMLWLAICFMTLDLAKVLLLQRGFALPVIFPGGELVSWAIATASLVWVVPIVFRATETLEDNVTQLEAQVTKLQVTNERLQESERLRKSISDTAPVGIVVFDAKGNSIFANSFAVARLGPEVQTCHRDRLPWTIMDHSGIPFSSGNSPLERVGKGRRALYGEHIAVERPEGRRIYLSLSAAPLGGAEDGIVVAFEDVTQRVEMERRHLHAQRLASMGEMAGFLAHDFNNFLTVIRGDSQMLLTHASADPSCRTRLERIIQTSDHAAEVCRQLLAFARRDQNPPYPLSISALLEDNRPLLETLLPEDVTLTLELAPDLPLVLAEPSTLLQIVLNLVSNARDAMPSGGRIKITSMQSTSAEGVMLVVEDTGVGMDQEMLRSIFEPYFTTKPRGRGTGLGLAIVYGVMEQLHGWIRVESQLGSGTRFLLHFPAANTLLP